MIFWMVLYEHKDGPAVFPRPDRVVQAISREEAIEKGLRGDEKLVGCFDLTPVVEVRL